MKFGFKNFIFDVEKQILTQDGKVITLNEKPAQLLTLFLRETDKVHHKADILDDVWPDRAIGEQVVFQNISYLRALFGDETIKTFVKKGYQWQLPLVELEENLTLAAPTVIKDKQAFQISPHNNDSPMAIKRPWLSDKIVATVGLLLSAALIYGLWFKSQQSTVKTQRTLITLAVEHQQTDLAEIITKIITNNAKLDRQFAPAELQNQSLFDSPFSTWQALANDVDSLVMATRFYALGDQDNSKVLRFYIQGAYRGWQGHIMAVNQEKLVKQLSQLLELLADSEYFSIKSEHFALAKLTALYNLAPENPLITHQLVKINYQLGHLDRAAALVDTQLDAEVNSLDLGLFHLLKANIVLGNSNWQSAQSSIDIATKAFSELNLAHLESLSREKQAWYEIHNQNYPSAKQSLNFSISKARMAKEPLQEVLIQLVQAALAGKNKQTTLMSNELELARQLFSLHQLGDEHQVPVLFVLAANAPSAEERLVYYERILTQPFSPQYQERFYYAAQSVRDGYINKQQWQLAKTSIKPWQRGSFVSLSDAHIAFAQLDWAGGVAAAIKSFRRAQIDYELQDALNAALLLLESVELGGELSNPTEYIDYIKQNANHGWLRDNQSALEKLKLLKDVASF
jgi:DNA-binding winged helix-turn-helix (wHTH) protein